MAASKGKLEVFELIAQDPSTDSYLARWNGSTWIVLRRARSNDAARGIAQVTQTAYRLVHPNVVRTFDPIDDLPELRGAILLEEYVEGERLADWMQTLAESPLPWQVACAIVRDAAAGASAIQAAADDPRAVSELGPQRLVLGFDGSVRIVDPCAELRLAPMASDERQRYAAPELDGGAANASSAVFGLGRILSELLTQASDTPKALERILQRASAEPPARYRTPAELAAALDALLDDPEPVQAYFAKHFAEERHNHAEALRAISSENATALGGESGFTDEIKTAVMTRAPEAPAETLRGLPDFDDPPKAGELVDFEESGETEELRLDEVLGAFAADADEDIRTRPFRREVLSKLKRTERETLSRGGARVAVVPTAVQPPRQGSNTPDENVIVESSAAPPMSAEQSEETPLVNLDVVKAARAAIGQDDHAITLRNASANRPVLTLRSADPSLVPREKPRRPSKPVANNPKALAAETVMIRAVSAKPNRTRDVLVLTLAIALVLGVALWAFLPR